MGGYLGLGDLGSDIQDPNCSEARYSIHSLSLGLRDQIQVTFVVSEALRGKILDTFVDLEVPRPYRRSRFDQKCSPDGS